MVNPFHSPVIKAFNSLETPCFYLAVGILNFKTNICKAIPTAGIWTQFYDNNELLALAERIELPTYWLQINCTAWLCYASNIISAQLDSNQRFPVPKTGGVDQTPLCTASFLGGSSTTGLPALLVHFRSLPSEGLPSGGVQNLNWTMHWKL